MALPPPISWFVRGFDRWNATLPGRVLKRFGDANGGVLGAGIAYYGVFSIFPALALGFTAFASFLGGREDLQADLVEYVNRTFGFELVGLTDESGGVVSVDALTQSTTLGTTAVIGAAVLLWTGLGWLSATRAGVREVFGQPPGQNFFVGKLWDLLTLVVLGVLVLTSVVTSVVVSTFTGTALRWLGIEGGAVALSVTVLTALALFAANSAILVLFYRLLGGVRMPWRDLFAGAAVGAVGLGLLTLGGGLLLRQASRNQFLATFGAIVVLLLWANLAARLCLIGAAWACTVAVDRGHLVFVTTTVREGADGEEATGDGDGQDGDDGDDGGQDDGGRVTAGRRVRRTDLVGTPTYGQRGADRVSVAAGAVIGAGALVSARIVTGAARALRDALR